MNISPMGPVAREMTARLEKHLAPARIELRDDSEQHRGHGGYREDGGESHFFLRIESAAFTGQSRVGRQRLVYKALGDLMHERVHALAMETRAPGE
ncbi:BolA protein [Sphingomonas kaistensis]|uniref:BolA protein n=1 Tax=Sphingomonas kaistensis TaxID=298708 RepID=A0A7X5Y4H4_9SPHN|nr:BolA family protein [Sphingomonas kaistensis]NJC05014.1 BolA protein [Sphingomonas kaistensis]